MDHFQAMSFETEALAGSPPAETGSAVGPQTETGIADPSEPTEGVKQGGQRQSEYVTYPRFQEKVHQLQTLDGYARDLGYSSAAEYLEEARQRHLEPEYEEPETSYEDNPTAALQAQVRQQGTLLAEIAFKDGFASLKEQFPQADREDVKTYLMTHPRATFDSAMQWSHQREETKRQQWLAQRTNTEAQRNSAGAEGTGGGQVGGTLDWANMPSEEFHRRKQAELEKARQR